MPRLQSNSPSRCRRILATRVGCIHIKGSLRLPGSTGRCRGGVGLGRATKILKLTGLYRRLLVGNWSWWKESRHIDRQACKCIKIIVLSSRTDFFVDMSGQISSRCRQLSTKQWSGNNCSDVFDQNPNFKLCDGSSGLAR